MKRPKLNRRALAGLPPGPVYRDVAPGCEVVALYDDEGEPLIVCDMDSRIVATVRMVAKAERTTFAHVYASIIRDSVDRHHRGF